MRSVDGRYHLYPTIVFPLPDKYSLRRKTIDFTDSIILCDSCPSIVKCVFFFPFCSNIDARMTTLYFKMKIETVIKRKCYQNYGDQGCNSPFVFFLFSRIFAVLGYCPTRIGHHYQRPSSDDLFLGPH